MAELVEYCYGGANTTWGAQRISDGHPSFYNLRIIELGNEQMPQMLFFQQVKAMEAKAIELGVGKQIHYVYPWGRLMPAVATTEQRQALAKVASALQLGARLVLDQHTTATRGRLESAVPDFEDDARNPLFNQDNHSHWGFANYETNTGNYFFSDALDEAADLFLWFGLNGSLAERVRGRAKSFCMERSGYNEGGANEQGMIWSLPNMTFLQPPAQVHKLLTRSWQPVGLAVKQRCEVEGSAPFRLLNVSSAMSANGHKLVLRIVNLQFFVVNTTLRLPAAHDLDSNGRKNHSHGWRVRNVTTLEPPEPGQTQAVNTPAQPERIRPRQRLELLQPSRRDSAGAHAKTTVPSLYVLTVPPTSFAVVEFEQLLMPSLPRTP